MADAFFNYQLINSTVPLCQKALQLKVVAAAGGGVESTKCIDLVSLPVAVPFEA